MTTVYRNCPLKEYLHKHPEVYNHQILVFTFIGCLPLSGFVVSFVQVSEAGSHLQDSCQRCDVKLAY